MKFVFTSADAFGVLSRSPSSHASLIWSFETPKRKCSSMRRGLSAVSGLLADRDDGLASLAGAEGPDAGLPPPRLHGPFDPLLHGWADRSFVLGATKGIVTSNGIFRPFALVNGRAVATWSLAAGKIRLAPFTPLGEADEAVLAADAGAVLDYLGLRRPRA